MQRLNYRLSLAMALSVFVACSSNEGVTQPEEAQSERSVKLIPDEKILDTETGARIRYFQVAESFFSEFGNASQVGISTLPPYGTSCPGGSLFDVEIPNPIQLGNAIFSDPTCLRVIGCPCNPDDNLLLMSNGGMLDFIETPEAVLVALEGMGVTGFALRVEDGAGSILQVSGQTLLDDIRYVGFASSNGIKQIRLIETSSGAFSIMRVWLAPSDTPIAAQYGP